MKTSKTIVALGLFASLALLPGCDKGAEPKVGNATKPAEVAKPSVEKTIPAVPAVPTAPVAAAVTNAAAVATAATAEVHAAANAKADSIIDQAKALVSQSKYSDALGALQKLSGLTLSDSQKALVTSLKQEIQKAMATQATTNAAGAVNSLLPK